MLRGGNLAVRLLAVTALELLVAVAALELLLAVAVLELPGSRERAGGGGPVRFGRPKNAKGPGGQRFQPTLRLPVSVAYFLLLSI